MNFPFGEENWIRFCFVQNLLLGQSKHEQPSFMAGDHRQAVDDARKKLPDEGRTSSSLICTAETGGFVRDFCFTQSIYPKIGKKFKMLYFKEYFIEYTQRLNQFVTIFRNNDWHHIPRIILK